MTDRFDRTELPGGLVVLSETMPGIRSASLGVWVRAGSVTETPADMGISHLLEHMVFKGTTQRTARELALVLERLGGSLDAYTTREHTSFQARVLDSDIDIGMDVLADLVLDPLLREADLELERAVVIEEIATVEDTPDDLIFDLQAAQMWRDHPYGYSILGTRATVSAFTTHDLRRVHSAHYHRGNVVIAAAGKVEHERFVERVAAAFADAPGGLPSQSLVQLPSRNGQPRTAPARTCMERDSAQTHIVWGCDTFGHGDPRRYALVLLSNAFGGGMSSRLFQRVREELGLAYAVYAFQTFYAAAGVNGVYVGTRPETADLAEAVVTEELARLAADGMTAEELADVKGQVKGQIVLSLESSSSRLHRLAGTELYGEPFRTMDEITALVDAVTLDDVAALAAHYFQPDRHSVLRLGPSH
ncbi:MAG TPA: pitrilysin family protein [Longimicrobiales bacterium]|nr:pitrilysin family protein [Longimicrobiales bacterium]